MKYLKIYYAFWALILLLNSCGPSQKDCDVSPASIENLITITPIQSQFRVNDTLTIACTIPAQNTYFSDFNLNIFRETGDTRAVWIMVNNSQLLRNQELITRKGFFDAGFFIMVYSEICDCYEFEADLILSEIATYNVSTSNSIDFRDAGCDGYVINSSFPWINSPNLLEFEVVP